MEFRADLRLTLKSSCDNCTASKVKCSGEDPCSRCVKKGISCFYSPKKKRGPLKKRERAALVANQPTVLRSALDGSRPLSSLGSHERRSWSVFFTLYKHYAVSCSLFWFNRQLHKMRLYLVKQKKSDALKRLSSWMDALNIDEDELAGKVEACKLKIQAWGKEGQAKADAEAKRHRPIEWKSNDTQILNRGGSPFHLRVNGKVEEEQLKAKTTQRVEDAFIGFETSDPNVPYIKFKVDYTHPGSESKVFVSPAFVSLMGYTAKDIEKDLEDSGGGFLPWGGDVLSRILVSEADLLSFVQILAIKFNTLGRPTEYPVVRSVPSVHVFKINHRDAKEAGPTDAILRCSHREVLSDQESALDVFMSFTPLNQLQVPSLPITDRCTITDHVELPPKRVKTEPVIRLDDEADVDSDQGDASGDLEGNIIYNYSGATQEIADATRENETFLLPPHHSPTPSAMQAGTTPAASSSSSSSSSSSTTPQATPEPYQPAPASFHRQPFQHTTQSPGAGGFDSPSYQPTEPSRDHSHPSEVHVVHHPHQMPELAPAPLPNDEFFGFVDSAMSEPFMPAPLDAAPAQHQHQHDQHQHEQQHHHHHHHHHQHKTLGSPHFSSSPGAGDLGTDDAILDSLPFVDSSDEDSGSVNADDGEWLDELLQWTGPGAIPSTPAA